MLQRFENRLEQLVSGAFARAFRSAVQPVEVAAALQREVDNSAQILSRDRRLVPNSFHVELSPPTTTGSRRTAPRWPTSSSRCCASTPRSSRYVFTGPVTIAFDSADDLTTGRFRVRSAALAKVTPASGASVTDTAVRRASVVLEVNGDAAPARPAGPRHRPRHRGRPAHQRPGRLPPARRDPGLPRRAGVPPVSVVDLGSTNGMLVNGHRVQQATLDDGATVKIGNTTMTVRHVRIGARGRRFGCLS